MAFCSSGCITMWVFVSGLFLALIPGVLCDNYDIGGLCTAAAVSIVLLAVVILMTVGGAMWNSWFPKFMWGKGKVKMPREYWQRKKEMELRLLYGNSRYSGLGSVAAPSEAGLPNGHSRVHDTEETRSDKASWIQGWNNAHPMDERGYEEMALAMDIGEEDVHIMTQAVDNETLNLRPFGGTTTAAAANPITTTTNTTTTPIVFPITRASGAAAVVSQSRRVVHGVSKHAEGRAGGGGGGRVTTSGQQPTMMVVEDQCVYSTVDRSSRKHTTTTTSTSNSATATPAVLVTSADEKVTSFSKEDPYLVAL